MAAGYPSRYPSQISVELRAPNDDPSCKEWELDFTKLKKQYVGPNNKLYSPRFDLLCPSSSSPINVRIRCHAYLSNEGLLSFFIELPVGMSARYCQWVGPKTPQTRIAANSWMKEGQGWGARDYWKATDHLEGNTLKLGIALILVSPPQGLEPAGSRFQLGATLGSGSFGSVQEATDTLLGRGDLAAKISRGGLVVDLLTEYDAMRQLQEHENFPDVIGLFRGEMKDQSQVFVMQKLHRDLESLRRDPHIGPKNRLSPECVVEIGCQTIKALKVVHHHNFLHRDLKPDNCMIGESNGQIIYLVDFGLAEPYRVAGMHVAPREQNKGLCGTARYASIHAHAGLQSRRSDLEALAYVLIYLAIGKLPWQGCPGSQKQQRYDNILAMKNDLNGLERHMSVQLKQARGLSRSLLELVKYCRDLAFEEEPDYSRIINSLRMSVPPSGLDVIDSGVTCNDPGQTQHRLDWVTTGYSATKVPSFFGRGDRLPSTEEAEKATTARATHVSSIGQDINLENSEAKLEPLSKEGQRQQMQDLREPILKWVVSVIVHVLDKGGKSEESLRRVLLDNFETECPIAEANLSDGRILCALLIALRPNLGLEPHSSELGRLGQVQRIARDLGLRDSDLFSSADLFPGPPQNPLNVLAFLFTLAGFAKNFADWDGPQLEVARPADTGVEPENDHDHAVLEVIDEAGKRRSQVPLRPSRVGLEVGLEELVPPQEEAEGEKVYVAPAKTQSLDLNSLPLLRGHLWKRSPDARKLYKYQWRYFIVKDMHILWWRHEDDQIRGQEARGCLNLLVHLTAISTERNSQRFVLRPAKGKWVKPESFTKGEEREFFFDCTGSEHHRASWLEVLAAHISHAERVAQQVGYKEIESIAPQRRISYLVGSAPSEQ